MTPDKILYTAEDLLRNPPESGMEFVNGQVVKKPVSFESAEVCANVNRLLFSEILEARRGWIFGSEVGYRCFPKDPSRYRKPDLSVLAARPEPIAISELERRQFPFPPDLAVEVINPTDTAYGLSDRIEDYMSSGFPLLWIAYPNVRIVMIHRSDGSVARLRENDEITGESALPKFHCKVAEFFSIA
jgi:Uma2 family endonuclease